MERDGRLPTPTTQVVRLPTGNRRFPGSNTPAPPPLGETGQLHVDKTISQDAADNKVVADNIRPRMLPQSPVQSSDESLSDSSSSGRDYQAGDRDQPDKPRTASKIVPAIRNALKDHGQLQGIHGSSEASRVIEYLLLVVAKGEAEIAALKADLRKRNHYESAAEEEDREASGNVEAGEREPPVSQMIHCVNCDHDQYGISNGTISHFYYDVPRSWKGDSPKSHIRGQSSLGDMSRYWQKHPSRAFLSAKKHYCAKYLTLHEARTKFVNRIQFENGPLSKNDGETVVLSPKLHEALETVFKHSKERFPGFGHTTIEHLLSETFLFFFYYGNELALAASMAPIDDWEKSAVRMLCDHIEKINSENWEEARAQFARSRITVKHYDKLFKPGELVVKTEEGGQFRLVKTQQYPWFKPRFMPRFGDDFEPIFGPSVDIWVFNGKFFKHRGVAKEQVPIDQAGKDLWEKDITSLDYFPLRYAPPDTFEKMAARGEKVWKFRKPHLVCYMGDEDNANHVSQVERRFMVDYDMYRVLHPQAEPFSSIRPEVFLSELAMKSDTPPSDEFNALLPERVFAFDLFLKKWQKIRVDRITDVTWNKDAFKRLVVPKDTKELIQAVVTGHKQHSGTSPDIIEGKGNGLLILLHGSPGTGKTLTAESIAEQNEMPLYRVTCGDIGLEPIDVEKYLNSVLHIGNKWGCVVLLDEADVFVEERTLTDQKRNAIISVFLRVLEYYDGILVLTTNRVGTFDDAFKSRIQLALRYPDLGEEQREEIWRNLFHIMRRTRERVDFADLEMNVGKLAAVEINGRQIRNVITTARHLARFRGQRLVYKHVQDAIAAVVKFNEYLTEVRGATDEVLAREDKLR